jgi:small subunit ribosomal protein S16
MVVADKPQKRDGRYLEQVGIFNPLTEPATVNILEDRVKHWVSMGAQPSKTVSEIIEKQIPGYLSEITETRLARKRAQRAKRKAAAK